MKTVLYYGLRRYFPQQRRSELKKWLASSRKRFSAAYCLAHGRFDAKELVANMASRITTDFDILMVHSGYDKLTPMYTGTPADLVNELIAYCGPNRTLAMPTFVFGGQKQDPITYYKDRPFDVRRTVTEMGLMSEIFRRKPGVKRSMHPTHSVAALGPLAAEMTATHHLSKTKAGKDTPFEYMAGKKTVIVGLGTEYFRSLTQAKGVEDLLGDKFPIPFKTRSATVQILDETGKEFPYDLTIKYFMAPVRAISLRQLLNQEELTTWTFHGAHMWRTYANRVTEALLDGAKRGITVYGKVDPNWRPEHGNGPE